MVSYSKISDTVQMLVPYERELSAKICTEGSLDVWQEPFGGATWTRTFNGAIEFIVRFGAHEPEKAQSFIAEFVPGDVWWNKSDIMPIWVLHNPISKKEYTPQSLYEAIGTNTFVGMQIYTILKAYNVVHVTGGLTTVSRELLKTMMDVASGTECTDSCIERLIDYMYEEGMI